MNLTDARDIAADRQTVSAAMGSKFCLDIRELTIERKPDAAVYFWDHEFDEAKKIANSFSKWISQY